MGYYSFVYHMEIQDQEVSKHWNSIEGVRKSKFLVKVRQTAFGIPGGSRQI